LVTTPQLLPPPAHRPLLQVTSPAPQVHGVAGAAKHPNTAGLAERRRVVVLVRVVEQGIAVREVDVRAVQRTESVVVDSQDEPSR
jgi:hypothetical protein